MAQNRAEFSLSIVLMVYLVVVGLGAAAILIMNFPTEVPNASGNRITFPYTDGDKPYFVPFGQLGSADQGLLLLAALAGIAGSFLHAAQSLSTYIGNADFRASWAAWYLMRPWIGGILGLAIYFALRSGLFSGAGTVNVNPYGVVALGLLGGWFSKTTTDKLQEVFETLFKTEEDKKRKDKLQPVDRPVIDHIEPTPVPAGVNAITILGRNFVRGATALVGDKEVEVDFVSETQLRLSFKKRPAAGTEVTVRVKNPKGAERLSEGHKVSFE